MIRQDSPAGGEGIIDESPLNEAAEANADKIVDAYENDKNAVPF